jgi:hypothetical protein
MIKKEETLSIGWIDNGTTDGKFTEQLLFTTLMAPSHDIKIDQFIRVSGNQIARQREDLIKIWKDQMPSDWLLWVDSDIGLSLATLKILYDNADKDTVPVLSGVYFISRQAEQTLPDPEPCIFYETDDIRKIGPVEPFPENELIKIDSAGMGLVLMHKSIFSKLDKITDGVPYFAEHAGYAKDFISEDISFFRKLKKAGIPVHAHTGALAPHYKRLSLDINYYLMYMDNRHKINK